MVYTNYGRREETVKPSVVKTEANAGSDACSMVNAQSIFKVTSGSVTSQQVTLRPLVHFS